MINVSGVDVVRYVADPSGARPLGIQLNDVEHLNLSREYYPHQRRVGQVCDTVGVGTRGDFETDWLHLGGSIACGDPAYLGPSGTITNLTSFGSPRVGSFLSSLTPDRHLLTYAGLGFSTTVTDCNSKRPVTENDPADRVLIVSPGYAKVRIDQRLIMRSQ